VNRLCRVRVSAAWVSVCQILLYATNTYAAGEQAYLSTRFLAGPVGIKSWKTLRDERVVKQGLDTSCGAASLATLLNEYYGQSVTEQEILGLMGIENLRSSFQNMRDALAILGFRSVAVAIHYEQLATLEMPVIVYLKLRDTGHFSVLRGIHASTVWLADPSLGNRTYGREQFLSLWDARTGEHGNATAKGRVLAVLPGDREVAAQTGFFTKAPRRQTVPAIAQLRVWAGRDWRD